MASRRRPTTLQSETISEEIFTSEGEPFLKETKEEVETELSPPAAQEPVFESSSIEAEEEATQIPPKPRPTRPKKTEFTRKPRNIPRFSRLRKADK